MRQSGSIHPIFTQLILSVTQYWHYCISVPKQMSVAHTTHAAPATDKQKQQLSFDRAYIRPKTPLSPLIGSVRSSSSKRSWDQDLREAIGSTLRDARCTRGKSSISAVAKSVSSDLNGGRRKTALSERCPGEISQQCYCAFPCLP